MSEQINFSTGEILKRLSLSAGVSGMEGSACQTAAELLSKYSENVVCDSFGNVYANIAEPKNGAPVIMLDAHIDEVGLVVTDIDDDGFLKVAKCGGVDRRLLLAQQVIVHGKESLTGIITSKPPHLESDEERKKVPDFDDISIDIGMDKASAKQLVAPGDRITFYSEYRPLLNNRVSVKAVDDRGGVAAILYALELLKDRELNCGLSVLFSSQEELGLRGATIGSYLLKPDIAVSVDVSFGYTSDAPEHKCGKMGEGPMIGIAPTLDQEISSELIQTASDNNIAYQLEVMGEETSTNADAIGMMGGGIKTGLVSIPIRYMHTPIETVVLADIENVGCLLAKYVERKGAGER